MLCLLPAAAGAVDGGQGTSLPDRNENSTMQFSSAFSSEGTAGESESTLFFNDGFGRMTEFDMVSENQVMTLTIRQNMRIVWKGSCHVKDNAFSVARRESNGQVYFLITMGEHRYRGDITRDDRWELKEEKEDFSDKILKAEV